MHILGGGLNSLCSKQINAFVFLMCHPSLALLPKHQYGGFIGITYSGLSTFQVAPGTRLNLPTFSSKVFFFFRKISEHAEELEKVLPMGKIHCIFSIILFSSHNQKVEFKEEFPFGSQVRSKDQK